jgi:hypothetical protein
MRRPAETIATSEDRAACCRPTSPDQRHCPSGAAASLGPGASFGVADVLIRWLRDPLALARMWNWKSALLSSMVRGGLFFAVNLQAGARAALGAFLTEWVLRAVTAGFYGAATQSFRRVEPAWVASLAVMVVLPVMTHSIELVVHYLRETPRLLPSIAVSAAFTVVSTQFSLYAMRRGALIVGDGCRPLWWDLRQVPGLVAGFLGAAVRPLARLSGSVPPRPAHQADAAPTGD